MNESFAAAWYRHPTGKHRDFVAARQVMLAALAEWLETRPKEGDVAIEIDDTDRNMRQLLLIARL